MIIALAALLFRTSASSNCITISHNSSQIRHQSGCLIVVDCIFARLNSQNGGAIYTSVGSDWIQINGSSFLACSATESGGGCSLSSVSASLSLCCASSCSAHSYGTFVYANSSTRQLFDIVGVDSCTDQSEWNSVRGTLYFQTGVIVNVSNLNLMRCNAYHSTCFSSLRSAVVDLTSRFSSFVNNSGQYGIYSPETPNGLNWFILSCNIFNNSVSDGTLYSARYGMIVNACHFFRNVADIGSSSSFVSKHIITNSFFSESIPSGSSVSVSNCRGSATDSMLPISTRFCPTYSASQSPNFVVSDVAEGQGG
jgi:hypothetical protein